MVTVNRGPPAAVWGYHRHQYLQVHTGPGNPWEGTASSACPCMCMPVHRMHPRAGNACSSANTWTPLHVQTHAQGPRPWHAYPSMGDHPAGCDPLPQPPPPKSGLVQRSLGKAGSYFTTPTTAHLLTTCWGPHVASPVAPTAPRGRNQIKKQTQRGRVICLWSYSHGLHHSLSIGLLTIELQTFGLFPSSADPSISESGALTLITHTHTHGCCSQRQDKRGDSQLKH